MAIGLRLAVGLMMPMSTDSDAGSYLAMATSAAEGNGLVDGFGNRAYYSAGYPMLLAAVFLLTGPNLGAVLAVNLVLAAAAVFLVHRVARCAARDERAGLLAALAWAVYVPSIVLANDILKENLMIPLMLGLLWIALAWPASSRRVLLAAVAGGIAGILAVVGATGCAVAGVLAAMILVHGASWRQRLAAGGALLLAALAVVAPWLYRNHVVVGAPVLSTNSGFNLYMGNNPAATGRYVSIAETPMGGEWNRILAEEGEVAAEREAARRAWKYMRANPGRTLTLFLKKAAVFWEPPYLRSAEPEPLAKRVTRYVWFAQYLVLIGLALAGLGDLRRTWPLYLAIVLFAAIHLPFVVMLRYRLPMMAVLAAGSGKLGGGRWKLGAGSWRLTMRRYLPSLAVLYALAIAVVTLLPSGTGTPLAGWDSSIAPGVQNALHLPAYTLLVILLMAAFGSSAHRRWLALGLITAGCIAFGLGSEWLQAVAIPGRHGSLTDALSNTLGCLLGAGSWTVGVRCQVSGVRNQRLRHREGQP